MDSLIFGVPFGLLSLPHHSIVVRPELCNFLIPACGEHLREDYFFQTLPAAGFERSSLPAKKFLPILPFGQDGKKFFSGYYGHLLRKIGVAHVRISATF